MNSARPDSQTTASRISEKATPSRSSCREFLGHAGAVIGGNWAFGSVLAAGLRGFRSSLSAAPSKSPNEKLDIGCIGNANQATFSTNHVAHENIVAICDVDDNCLNEAAKRFNPPQTIPNSIGHLSD